MEDVLGRPLGQAKGPRGTLTAWEPVPGVFVTQAEGHITVELTALMIHQGNEVLRRHGKLIAFHHWWDATGYDPEARKRLTEWGFRIREDVEKVHFLVSSRLLRMGISVASIVLVGMLMSHGDPEAFDTELRRTMTARQKAAAPRD